MDYKFLLPITYFLMASAYFVLSWPESPSSNHYFGVLVTIAAFTCWIIARIQLGSAFSITPQAKYLVTSGIYSKLRHPVYYFSMLALTGIGVYIWKSIVLLPITLLITLEWIRIKKEEAVLTKTFGKEYKQYKQNTWF